MLRRPQRNYLSKFAPDLLGPPHVPFADIGDNRNDNRNSNASLYIHSDTERKAGEEIVNKFRKFIDQINMKIFETPNLCSHSKCRRQEMDWTSFTKPDYDNNCDNDDKNANRDGTEGCFHVATNMSYRTMAKVSDARVASADGTAQVKGVVIQCME